MGYSRKGVVKTYYNVIKMKTCFLTHNCIEDNGGGVFSRKLIQGLTRELGATCVVLTAISSGAANEHPVLHSYGLIKNFFTIRRYMKESDIIHAIDILPYGAIAVMASLGLRKKIVLTAIGSGSVQGFYDWRYRLLMRFVCKRAVRITAISNFTKKEIIKNVPDISVSVMLPGIDFENFRRKDSGILPDAVKKFQPYILSVGALRWRKGYKYSIPAFSDITREFPDLSYCIVGKRYGEKEYRKLKSIIAEHGLEKRVHILDDITDPALLRAFYWGAELFCLMSQNWWHDVEGFGIVFLEAAAAGLPVVGTTDSGIEDAVLNGENGVLVDPRDFDGFAKAIVGILKDPQRKARMGEKSTVFAGGFDWSVKIREYVKMYQNIAF